MRFSFRKSTRFPFESSFRRPFLPPLAAARSQKNLSNSAQNCLHSSKVNWQDSANRRVVITGLGITCPLGVGVQSSWKRLLSGQSGLISIRDRPEFSQVPSQVAAVVAKDELRLEERFARSELNQLSLGCLHALIAAEEAFHDAKLEVNGEEQQKRTGTIIGAGMVDLDQLYEMSVRFKQQGYNKLSPHFVTRSLINMPAGQVSIRHQLRGPNSAPSTACTTGAHAIGDSYQLIKIGRVDRMLAGGVDCVVNPIVMAAFCRARALSTKFNDQPQQASRPFDRQRDGFVIGEGCGLLVLEELESARARGARIYAEILGGFFSKQHYNVKMLPTRPFSLSPIGYGMSADAHHITSPSPDGRGAFDCMSQAMQEAGITPQEVEHVNCHATSTPVGDEIELKAIKNLFGTHCTDVWLTSTKGAVGHLLGGAGAVEAIFTTLACANGQLPATLNLREPIDGQLKYVTKKNQSWDQKCSSMATSSNRRIALTNSFGFGGTNASLVISEFRA